MLHEVLSVIHVYRGCHLMKNYRGLLSVRFVLNFFTFVSDSGDSGRIDYDEKAVLSLLDRTSSHDDAPDEEKDIMANEYLASFKVRRKKFTFDSILH